MAKPKWVWIARNRSRENNYVVSPYQRCRLVPTLCVENRLMFGGDPEAIRLCPSAVHRVLGIRLKPGEGPVRIKIRAELVRD